jgi:hypothetical protein
MPRRRRATGRENGEQWSIASVGEKGKKISELARDCLWAAPEACGCLFGILDHLGSRSRVHAVGLYLLIEHGNCVYLNQNTYLGKAGLGWLTCLSLMNDSTTPYLFSKTGCINSLKLREAR